jgi:hypothetical protein
VTKDNVDQYLSVFFGDVDPVDWQLMSQKAHPDDWDPQNGVLPIDMDKMWAGQPQPAGWTAPPPYAAAMAAGDYPKVSAEYADHWKITLP